jgi:hypothetical protein
VWEHNARIWSSALRWHHRTWTLAAEVGHMLRLLTTTPVAWPREPVTKNAKWEVIKFLYCPPLLSAGDWRVTLEPEAFAQCFESVSHHLHVRQISSGYFKIVECFWFLFRVAIKLEVSRVCILRWKILFFLQANFIAIVDRHFSSSNSFWLLSQSFRVYFPWKQERVNKEHNSMRILRWYTDWKFTQGERSKDKFIFS